MENAKFKARDVAPTVLRLHPEIRAELVRLAFVNGRSLSKEIAIRLEESLRACKTGDNATTYKLAATNNDGPASALSDTDQAMLDIFRNLPPEKRLALLSLFR